jgi:hypothetical protein
MLPTVLDHFRRVEVVMVMVVMVVVGCYGRGHGGGEEGCVLVKGKV